MEPVTDTDWLKGTDTDGLLRRAGLIATQKTMTAVRSAAGIRKSEDERKRPSDRGYFFIETTCDTSKFSFNRTHPPGKIRDETQMDADRRVGSRWICLRAGS